VKDIERARVRTIEPTAIDRDRMILLKNHIGKYQSNLLAFNLRKYFQKWKSKRHMLYYCRSTPIGQTSCMAEEASIEGGDTDR